MHCLPRPKDPAEAAPLLPLPAPADQPPADPSPAALPPKLSARQQIKWLQERAAELEARARGGTSASAKNVWGDPGVGDGVRNPTVERVEKLCQSKFKVVWVEPIDEDIWPKQKIAALRRTVEHLPGLDDQSNSGNTSNGASDTE